MENVDLFENIKTLSGPILLTGHTGFKGSWLVQIFDLLEIEYFGVSLPPIKDSPFKSEKLIEEKSEYFNIQDTDRLRSLIRRIQPSLVIHFAAQSLVSEGYRDPLETYKSNVSGTISLIEAIMSNSENRPPIFVSTTDKVYSNNESGISFKEDDPLGGLDPYSSSKAMVEIYLRGISSSYSKNSSNLLFTGRAGNVIGGGDVSKDRLLPDIVRGLTSGEVVSIRNPNSTRPWQHVLDALFGYLIYINFFLGKEMPASLNFGPYSKGLTVNEILTIASLQFGDRIKFAIKDSNPDMREAQNLDLDCQLALDAIGWSPIWTQEKALVRTFDWWEKFLRGHATAEDICRSEILNYIEEMKAKSNEA